MARGLKRFADDVLGIDPGGGGIVGSVSNIADDVLGIDPSGEGIFGSIRDNPIIPAALNFIPGIGPVAAGLIGAGGNLVGGAGLPGALRGFASGYGGGKFLEGFTGAPEGASFFDKLGAGESSIFGGLPGYGSVAGALGPGGANLLYGGLLGSGISALGSRPVQAGGQPGQGFLPFMGGGMMGDQIIGQSALDYARSISGGIPFEQIVQPGMQFSPNQPMGGPVAPPSISFPGFPGVGGGGPLGPIILDGGGGFPGSVGGPGVGPGFGGPIFDPFRDGVRPTEIFGPDGQIIGPAGSSADYSGGVINLPDIVPPVGGLPQGRPAPFDPFRDGVRPTEIFGPGGQLIGSAGSSADLMMPPMVGGPNRDEAVPLDPPIMDAGGGFPGGAQSGQLIDGFGLGINDPRISVDAGPLGPPMPMPPAEVPPAPISRQLPNLTSDSNLDVSQLQNLINFSSGILNDPFRGSVAIPQNILSNIVPSIPPSPVITQPGSDQPISTRPTKGSPLPIPISLL